VRSTTRSSPRSAPSAPASCALAMGVDSEVLDIPAEGVVIVMSLFSVELKNQPVLFSASDEAAVRTALEGACLEFTERPALQVKCADQAGEAAKFGRADGAVLIPSRQPGVKALDTRALTRCRPTWTPRPWPNWLSPRMNRCHCVAVNGRGRGGPEATVRSGYVAGRGWIGSTLKQCL
jgi:hypothetical protein